MPIGFFAPLPLALMIPFMAGQSLAMGEAFGKGFQYGKRKISSMSNEEFNALDFKGLAESIATDYKDLIPSLQESIKNSERLQQTVFDTMGKIITNLPANIVDFIIGLGNATATTTSTGGSTITGVRLDIGQGSRGQRDPLQQGGASLFEKDEQRKREREEAEIRKQDKSRVASSWSEFIAQVAREMPLPTGPSKKALNTPRRRKSQSSKLQLTAFARVSKQIAQNISRIKKTAFNVSSRNLYRKQWTAIVRSQIQWHNLNYIYI